MSDTGQEVEGDFGSLAALECPQGARQGFFANAIGLVTELADGVCRALNAQPAEKMVDFGINDFFGLLGRFLAGFDAFLDGVAKVVHGVEIDVAQLFDLRFDVPRDGQVDHEHGFVLARLDGAFHAAFAEDGQRAAGG